jgi:GNAT superfamily N-acetyltransferase
MSNFQVRRGRRAEAPMVRKLLASILCEHGLRTVDARADTGIVRFGASDTSHDDLVAVRGDEVIGFLVLAALGEGAAELSHVFVGRTHRGRGVGTALVARAIEIAKARGYERLHLSTLEAFADARAYYARHGWIHEEEDGTGSLFFTLHLRQAPRESTPESPRLVAPLPRTLRGVLSLLDRFTRLRAQLESELAVQAQAPADRAQRHRQSS